MTGSHCVDVAGIVSDQPSPAVLCDTLVKSIQRIAILIFAVKIYYKVCHDVDSPQTTVAVKNPKSSGRKARRV
jgi:hypothetical protein